LKKFPVLASAKGTISEKVADWLFFNRIQVLILFFSIFFYGWAIRFEIKREITLVDTQLNSQKQKNKF